MRQEIIDKNKAYDIARTLSNNGTLIYLIKREEFKNSWAWWTISDSEKLNYKEYIVTRYLYGKEV